MDLVELVWKNDLFQSLTKEQVSLIVSKSQKKHIHKNEYVVREGEIENEVYFIISGTGELLKKDKYTNKTTRISLINPGDLIGEMAFVDRSSRSASVRALQDMELLVLPLMDLFSQATNAELYINIITHISKQLSKKLRYTNEVTVHLIQQKLKAATVRVEMGKFLFIILVILSLWIFSVSSLSHFIESLANSVYITSSVLFILCLVSMYHIKHSIYSLSDYGLNLINWKKNAVEAIIFSLPLVAVSTLFKWLLVKYVSSLHDVPVFAFNKYYHHPFYLLSPAIYMMLCPFQEFISRGMFQTSIKTFFSGPYRSSLAIFCSALIFASFHCHLSLTFAIGAFIFGCFWGWMRDRQDSLVGPIVSHVILGAWILSMLDLGLLLITKLR